MEADDVVSWEMARVLAGKTGAERLAIAAGMFRSARRMIDDHLRAEHPGWEDERRAEEVARRVAHGWGDDQSELLKREIEKEYLKESDGSEE